MWRLLRYLGPCVEVRKQLVKVCLSFHRVDLRDWTYPRKDGWKGLYSLSHLADHIPGSFTGILGLKLRSSCLWDRHATAAAAFPQTAVLISSSALFVCFCRVCLRAHMSTVRTWMSECSLGRASSLLPLCQSCLIQLRLSALARFVISSDWMTLLSFCLLSR